MLFCRLAGSFSGMIQWRKLFENDGRTLFLIFPEFDEDVANALVRVTENDPGTIGEYEKVVCVFSDGRFSGLFGDRFGSVVLKPKKLRNLVRYYSLSSRQYGASFRKNVRLVSGRALAGQFDKVRESGLLSPESFVKEYILTAGGW